MKSFVIEFKQRYEDSVEIAHVKANSEVDAVGRVFDEWFDGDDHEVLILKVTEVEE